MNTQKKLMLFIVLGMFTIQAADSTTEKLEEAIETTNVAVFKKYIKRVSQLSKKAKQEFSHLAEDVVEDAQADVGLFKNRRDTSMALGGTIIGGIGTAFLIANTRAFFNPLQSEESKSVSMGFGGVAAIAAIYGFYKAYCGFTGKTGKTRLNAALAIQKEVQKIEVSENIKA